MCSMCSALISSGAGPGDDALVGPLDSSADHVDIEVYEPPSLQAYLGVMHSIRRRVRAHPFHGGSVVLFHYTHPSLAEPILTNGLRMSRSGQGDGGVYFSTLSPSSYGLGSLEYEENLISDCFGPERLEEYLGSRKLALLLVCVLDARLLRQAPGGRDNAFMVPKSLFEKFSLARYEDSGFYLPSSVIQAAIYMKPGNFLAADSAALTSAVRQEAQEDQATRSAAVNALRRQEAQSVEVFETSKRYNRRVQRRSMDPWLSPAAQSPWTPASRVVEMQPHDIGTPLEHGKSRDEPADYVRNHPRWQV